jgi:nicotinate-nucleotide adenylyltransferase
MSRIGIFGGTFDPVHVGHLDVARAALRAVELDRVLLMPANVPPHRSSPHASAPHRFAMCALAIAGHDRLGLLDDEMLSSEPSYTSSTLARLEARGMNTRELFLITGADAFRDIGSWKDYPAILDRCHFVVISRLGQTASSLRETLPSLAGRMRPASPRVAQGDKLSVVLVDSPTAPVSSTEIRRRAAGGTSLAGLVPDLVAEYIRKHELYGKS